MYNYNTDTLIMYLLKLKLYFIIALILSIKTSSLNRKHNIRALCLSKSIFKDDLDALALNRGGIEYLYFPSDKIQLIYTIVCKRHGVSISEISEYNYYDDKYEIIRKNLNEILEPIFRYLKLFINYDLIIAGQFSYIRYQELQMICKKYNIPFYVLYKEGIIGGNQMQHIIEEIKLLRYNATYISFYNEIIRDDIISANIGVTSANSNVVGIPKFDVYFNQNKLINVTLFSFNPITKLFNYTNSRLGIVNDNAEEMTKNILSLSCEFYQTIFDYFTYDNGYHLTIKCRQAPKDVGYIEDIITSILVELPDTIKFTTEEASQTLILNSEIIIGFNSTVLLEGLIAKKIVITPDYSELIGNTSFEILDRNSYFDITYLNNTEQLTALLDEDTEDSTYLKGHIGFSDGGSVNRVEATIRNMLVKK
jgi:hypothetical protein